jgi:hypothetical protein
MANRPRDHEYARQQCLRQALARTPVGSYVVACVGAAGGCPFDSPCAGDEMLAFTMQRAGCTLCRHYKRISKRGFIEFGLRGH